MWIDTLGGEGISGASGGDTISRDGLRPNAMAAISSIRVIATKISGISSTSASPNANAAPGTK